nr:hypothetical protein [bacterium]
MTKIVYENNGGVEMKKNVNRSNKFWKIICIIVISLIFGAISGVGSVILLSKDNGAIAKKIGFRNWDNLSIPMTETKKIVIEESGAIVDT